MAGLSLTRGRPIGVVHGGEGDKDVIGITFPDDGETLGETEGDPIEILGEDFFRGLKTTEGKKLKVEQLEELIEAVKKGEMPDDEKLEEAFHEALEAFMEQDKKEVIVSDEGRVIPVPNFETEREVLYIAGPSGSGKTTLAALYCHKARDAESDRAIHLFSRVKEDKALDPLKPTRHMIDDDLVKSPPDSAAEDFKGSIVIFDDIDTVTDKKQATAVQKLRDDMLETGRHNGTTVICTSHQLMNYSKTKVMLNEATAVIMFPRTGSKVHIKRYLKEHACVDKATLDKIMGLPSRWFLHNRTAPQYILHEKGAFVL